MRLRLVPAVAGAALAISLLTATGALGSTRIGDECAAISGFPGASATQLTAAPGPLPQTAPAGGIITSWGFNASIPELDGLPYTMKLKVLRSTQDPNMFTVVGESSREGIRNGSNSFSSRIPVQAGDRLGTGGGDELGVSLYCAPINPSDVLGGSESDAPVGSTQTFIAIGSARLALWAAIEPDADNDGFGDETQDACPQSAATQVACPVVTLSTTRQVRKGSVVIVVATNTAAPVTVKGVVKLGKGKKAKLNGGTKTLTPGILGRFTLKFPKKVKTKLADLSRKQSLTLKATVSGTNVAGQLTTKTIRVKLKGQAPTG